MLLALALVALQQPLQRTQSLMPSSGRVGRSVLLAVAPIQLEILLIFLLLRPPMRFCARVVLCWALAPSRLLVLLTMPSQTLRSVIALLFQSLAAAQTVRVILQILPQRQIINFLLGVVTPLPFKPSIMAQM